jgi:hypothetical protein
MYYLYSKSLHCIPPKTQSQGIVSGPFVLLLMNMMPESFFAKKKHPRLHLPLLDCVCAQLVLQSAVDNYLGTKAGPKRNPKTCVFFFSLCNFATQNTRYIVRTMHFSEKVKKKHCQFHKCTISTLNTTLLQAIEASRKSVPLCTNLKARNRQSCIPLCLGCHFCLLKPLILCPSLSV